MDNDQGDGPMLSEEHLARLKKYREPDKILDYLYLGDRLQGSNEETIKEFAITHVLNVHDSCRFPPASSPWKFRHVPVSDYGDSDLRPAAEKCFKFIEEARSCQGRVLVHCRKGINRSPTIVIAWLIVSEKWTLQKAYTFVQECRPMSSPHEKYFEQLQAMDKAVHGKISFTREDAGPSIQQILRNLRDEALQERQSQGETDEIPEPP